MLSRQEELIFSEYSLWTILHADAGAITIFAANALLEARHFFGMALCSPLALYLWSNGI